MPVAAPMFFDLDISAIRKDEVTQIATSTVQLLQEVNIFQNCINHRLGFRAKNGDNFFINPEKFLLQNTTFCFTSFHVVNI